MTARRPTSPTAQPPQTPQTPQTPTAGEGGDGSASDERVAAARQALLEGVGAEIAASFPGITRLGGQVVAALYLADVPRSMDELSQELGRSKSNIFANLRGLEAAGIIERRRESGARHDSFALRGKYPDVIVGAYLGRLRRVVQDKRTLARRALALLGDAQGPEADAMRARLDDLSRKYDLFAELMEQLLPSIDGPVDLERLIAQVPEAVVRSLNAAARVAWAAGDAISRLSGRAGRKR
ncbi:GbsR/MarR family transcriptional regulator [Sorangium sp. So ce1153]|uniref:GbsR/MarR family transcriptional regulator n=1 Tax=Sorangium sp. So ce1153 TaxID=3133333 RepID=UPI003F5F41BF